MGVGREAGVDVGVATRGCGPCEDEHASDAASVSDDASEAVLDEEAVDEEAVDWGSDSDELGLHAPSPSLTHLMGAVNSHVATPGILDRGVLPPSSQPIWLDARKSKQGLAFDKYKPLSSAVAQCVLEGALSEYEREQRATIAENNEFLRMLGLA